MKRSFPLFISMLVLLSLLLTACGTASPTTAAPSRSADASTQVEFVGQVEAIKDNQWTINGQTVEVSAELAKKLPFQVGDQVKVEAIVGADGSVKAQSMVAFGADSVNDNNRTDDNGNDNGNADNSNADNANDDNTNAGNSNADNSNDDNSNADNSNDDNANADNSNDDNGNDDNSNADNSNDDNSNDDNSNNDNSDDDNNNNGNSDDDNNNNDKDDDKDDD